MSRKIFNHIVFIVLILFISIKINAVELMSKFSNKTTSQNNIQPKLKDTKQENLEKIKISMNNKDFKYHAYEQTAYIIDTYGNRLYGSESLELALKYMKTVLQESNFENVQLEEIPNIPVWKRGKESMTLYSPRPVPSNIPIAGFGNSISADVKAEMIIVDDLDDLKKKKDLVKGKIVLFNHKWTYYGAGSKIRQFGAIEASKYGAVGMLLRSVTPKSLGTLHTGVMRYDKDVPKIPGAAVTLEDADMFERMQLRGQKIVVHIQMEDYTDSKPGLSHNLVGEIKGWKYPEQIILIGGHIDTWDLGPQTGANDDTAGFMVCYEAIRLLIKLGIKPIRTIRFIAWSGEEFGGLFTGARQYEKTHLNEMENHILAFESDGGTTNLEGFNLSGNQKIKDLVKSTFTKYLPNYKLGFDNGVMADTDILYQNHNISAIKNVVKDTPDASFYFTYHHTSADSISMLNKDDLDSNVLGIAQLFYLIADYEGDIPKENKSIKK